MVSEVSVGGFLQQPKKENIKTCGFNWRPPVDGNICIKTFLNWHQCFVVVRMYIRLYIYSSLQSFVRSFVNDERSISLQCHGYGSSTEIWLMVMFKDQKLTAKTAL